MKIPQKDNTRYLTPLSHSELIREASPKEIKMSGIVKLGCCSESALNRQLRFRL